MTECVLYMDTTANRKAMTECVLYIDLTSEWSRKYAYIVFVSSN